MHDRAAAIDPTEVIPQVVTLHPPIVLSNEIPMFIAEGSRELASVSTFGCFRREAFIKRDTQRTETVYIRSAITHMSMSEMTVLLPATARPIITAAFKR